MSDYSYIGVGKVYLRNRNNAGEGLKAIGNASAMSISTSEDSKTLEDFTKPGGGTYNEVKRISSAECSVTVHDYSPENLKRAIFGSDSAVVGSSVTDESLTNVKHGELAKTANKHISNVVVTTDPAGTTYVEGVDYTVGAAGIVTLATGSIADDVSLLISYDYASASVIEALTQSAGEYEVVFEGENEANGKSAVVTIHRLKLGAAEDISLIGTDYGALTMSGNILKDTAISAPDSQYYNVDMEL